RPKAWFNCGDPSHIKPQCPLLQSTGSNTYQMPVNVQTQPSSVQQGCFVCGDPSHFKRSCPQWLRNNPTAAVVSSTSRGPNNTQQKQSYGSTGKDNNSNVYINATIERIAVTCLLDSGCEQSLMPMQLIKRCGYAIRATDKMVRAANGTKLELAGEAKVGVRIGDDLIHALALISHDVDEVMLGYDFLTNNQCMWDFGCNQISIRGKTHKPFARHGPPKCRRVYVSSDIIVPAKQQVDLPVRSTINSLRFCTGTFATEAKSIQKGVYVGRTLLPAAHHDIAVRVINTTSEPRLVRKDTYLGV